MSFWVITDEGLLNTREKALQGQTSWAEPLSDKKLYLWPYGYPEPQRLCSVFLPLFSAFCLLWPCLTLQIAFFTKASELKYFSQCNTLLPSSVETQIYVSGFRNFLSVNGLHLDMLVCSNISTKALFTQQKRTRVQTSLPLGHWGTKTHLKPSQLSPSLADISAIQTGLYSPLA